jgi:hypothetical protein
MPQWIVWKRRWRNIRGGYRFWDGHLIIFQHRCVALLYGIPLLSFYRRVDGSERFEGMKRGEGRKDHYEIVPSIPMSPENFQKLLNQIKVSPAF